jgi:hypothetical protein
MKTKNINSTIDIDNYKAKQKLDYSDIVYQELSMKGMMNSCFAYSSIEIGSYDYQIYILPYKEKLTEKLFNEVYDEQKTYLSECTVRHGVYTDGEGCSYNEIVLK